MWDNSKTQRRNLFDYATGYATLASGGYKKDLYLIRKIEDKDGVVIYSKNEQKSLVLNPNYVYILNELLSNTTSSAFKDYTTATASTIASKLSKKYAGRESFCFFQERKKSWRR